MNRTVVARVITRLNIGGPARHALILTKGLDPARFETTLFAGDAPAAEGTIDGVDVVVTSVQNLRRTPSIFGDLGPFLQLRREFRRMRPAIVHTHMTNGGFVGRLAALVAGVPTIVHTYHGHVLSGYVGPFRTWALTAMERLLARRTDALIAVSPEVRDELLRAGIGKPEQWRVVRLGLELDELLELDDDSRGARAELGIPVDRPAVGIVGRLAPIKDHSTFLAAARRIAAKRDVTFVVAGDGELRRQLEKEAADLGGKVRFLGWTTDLPRLYAALDVVVLTSKNEGTPVALIEAMAAARPVVATQVGGVADCVPGDIGRLVPAGNSEAVAAAIEWFLDNPTLARGAGSRGRQWVKERYSAQRLVTDIERLYTELLTREGRP